MNSTIQKQHVLCEFYLPDEACEHLVSPGSPVVTTACAGSFIIVAFVELSAISFSSLGIFIVIEILVVISVCIAVISGPSVVLGPLSYKDYIKIICEQRF